MMKRFFLRHQKLHLWLLADLLVLAAYFLTRTHRVWMNAVTVRFSEPISRFLGRLCYRAEGSVMEVLCVLLVLLTAGYLAWNAAAVCRARGRRLDRAYAAVLGALCGLLTLYCGFCLLWGVNSYADSFQDRSGLRAQPVALDELERVTVRFAEQLTRLADQVPRDENGLFAVPREEILAAAPEAYGGLTDQWPFLAFDAHPPKAVRFSRVMSLLDFTGVYCPFTGEANVNVDSPACFLPATAAHELAHQRGVTAEQECDFLAVAAAVTCGNTAYEYSGALLAYVHLGNALYDADRSRWEPVYQSLPETVRADLSHNNAYWRQFQDTVVQKVSNQVYDSFLKSYGQEQGLKSYGTAVDLLVAYYK